MNAERFARIKEIFLALDHVPFEKQAAYLDEVCGDDATLRAEITALCAQDRSTIHDLLHTGELARRLGVTGSSVSRSEDRAPEALDAGTPTGASTTLDATGTRAHRIGPYVLRERIGAGGMGEVWRAEQTAPVRRTVALKLVKPGMDSAQVVARFEAERQALALMDHPYIAKVHDAGVTDRGRPYFVMEHVPGIPITDYCDQRRLDTKERLDLFGRVCEGVQHAHQKAVIHRDIKPSNILVADVDGKPLPKIIDFGVAKATTQKLTEKTMYTALGQIVGTPAYMSPEQAELTGQDIDIRTDVYGLGVLLYELLTGTLPFETETLRKAGLDAMRRIIREEEPPRPSTRISSLGAEATTGASRRRTDRVRWRKTLQHELDWITMKALEKDRNRRYETVAALSTDIGRYLADEPVAAGPPSTAYRIRKYIKRHRIGVGFGTTIALGMVLAFFLILFQNARIAAARDEAVISITSLEEILESVDPTKSGPDVTVREMLDETAKTIGDKFATKPLIEARLRHTIGKTYFAISADDAAETHLRRALEIRREHLGPEDTATLEVMTDLARMYVRYDRPKEAEALARECSGICRRMLGEEHPLTVKSTHWLAVSYGMQSRPEEAGALYEENLAISRRALGSEHPETLAIMASLGVWFMNHGRLDDADSLLEEAFDTRKRVLGREHRETLLTADNLAQLYEGHGRLEEAIALRRETLTIRRHDLGSDHLRTLGGMIHIASLHRKSKQNHEAEALEREVLTHMRRVLGDEHPRTLAAMGRLSSVLLEMGRLDEAERLRSEQLATRRRTLGDEHPETLRSMHQLAHVFLTNERAAEAEALNRSALQISRRVEGEDDRLTNNLRYNLACALAVLGRPAEAVSVLREALDNGFGANHWYDRGKTILDDPDLESLHGHPGFVAIADELRYRSEHQQPGAGPAIPE